MTIQIVPHAEDKKELVERFNSRMRDAGSSWGFYVEPTPRWIPPREGQKVWRELYLVIENADTCVGGYALKPGEWLVRGEPCTVTDWQGPFSLGAIDNHYASLGLRIMRDMLKKHPCLYSWGHGGNEEPIVQLLVKMGWRTHATPFFFRVCHPTQFLRKNAYLRVDPRKAIAQDVLAFSGLGAIGIRALHAGLRVRSLKLRLTARAEVVSEFGPWADELWARARGSYLALAVRDADTMNALIPQEHRTDDWPAPTRLRVKKDGRDLGWAIVLEKQKVGDSRYGDLRVGMIADTFGLPEDATEIAHAAFSYLRTAGVDIVIANQAHPAWGQGFDEAGFVRIADRRLMCVSPALEKAFAPFDVTAQGLLLSNLDGHGPIL